ncbi:pheromone-processing carboxypeptidase KEX1-like, partial [Aphis craccivora]
MRQARPPGKDNDLRHSPAANGPALDGRGGVSHLVSIGIRGAALGTSSKLRWRENASVSEQSCFLSTTDQQRWDTKVKDVERMLNTATNKTTSRTPYEVLHGYRPRFRSGVLSALSRTKNESTPPEDVQA